MDLQFFIVLLLVPLVLAQLGEKCSESDDTENPNFIQNPTNCSKFYSCGSGVYRDMECPARLHFNKVKKTCDWPSQAGCSFQNTHQPLLSFVDPSEGTSVVFPGDRCRPSSDRNSPRIAPYATSCKQFLICSGIWTLMDCPPGLMFSVETGHCEFLENAKCCPTCMETARSCSMEGEKMTHPTSCDKYFICINETFVEFECQDETIFSSTKGECIAGSCESQEEELVDVNDLPNCSTDGVLYPNYKDCSKFFICDGGSLVAQLCPPNKFYSVSHKNCQFRFFARCASEITVK